MKSYFSRKSVLFCGIFIIVMSVPQQVLAQPLSKNAYVVGPGDILQIQIWDHHDLNRSVEISQDGSFSFPFIGNVNVTELSVFQIEALLVQKLSDGYLVAPQVNITVTDYRNQKVFMFGEVKRPGSYVLKHRSHLLELISEAGGFTENRGIRGVVVRPEASADKNYPISIDDAKKSEIIQIDLEKLVSGGEGSQQFFIMPGDSIYIGKSESIFVTGEVKTPGKLMWKKGTTVRQAISLAGGGTPRASIRRIEIIRNDENGMELKIKPNLGDLVLPNDIIKVPESYF